MTMQTHPSGMAMPDATVLAAHDDFERARREMLSAYRRLLAHGTVASLAEASAMAEDTRGAMVQLAALLCRTP